MDYYVALDLGSESMAACYRSMNDDNGPRMIRLQHYAPQLASNPRLLLEGRELSPRLRTRIALKERRQPITILDSHASLRWVTPAGIVDLPRYQESLFQYFMTDQEFWGGDLLLMPNPKLLFHGGIKLQRMKVRDEGGRDYVDLEPAKLLNHVMVQIINNFILRSPNLRAIDPKEIHLMITIPNVYSIAHKKTIEDHLKTTLRDMGKIELIYESDATAFYLMHPSGETPELKQFTTAISTQQEHGDYHLLTIDVGRGTTDLSFIKFSQEKAPIKYEVLARTGRSDGGNRLSYILAGFYECQLQKVFELAGNRYLGNGNDTPPFLFTRLLPDIETVLPVQRQALEALEELIHEVKYNLDLNYRLAGQFDGYQQLIKKVVDRVMQGLYTNWENIDTNTLTDEESNLIRFSHLLIEALSLPMNRPLPREDAISVNPGPLVSQLITFLKNFISKIEAYVKKFGNTGGRVPPQEENDVVEVNGESDIAEQTSMQQAQLDFDQLKERVRPSSDDLKELRTSIEKYIEDNTVNLLKDLEAMTAYKTNHDIRIVLDTTFVLVSGQASQFKPMRATIEQMIGKLNITADRVHFLTGEVAKNACCLGALNHAMIDVEPIDPHYLHGTYAFRSAIRLLPSWDPIEPRDLNGGADVTIEITRGAEKHFVYVPQHLLVKDPPPEVAEGSVARLQSVAKDIDTATVRYDKTNGRLQLTLPGKPPATIRCATFNDVGGTSAVWSKMWPDHLPTDADINGN